MGTLDNAVGLHRRALQSKEKTPTHPKTLNSASSLAEILYTQKKFEEVIPLFRRDLQAKEETLGPAHANTITSIYKLALVLATTGNREEAEPLYRRAQQASEKVLGATHPITVSCADHLAMLLEAKSFRVKETATV